MNFFELNKLDVYDYQDKFVNTEFDNIYTKRKVLLAAAPGAGKTVTSIACIERFLKDNPSSRVLVLTHNQIILKEQYYDDVDALKTTFTYSKDINSDAQVVITLPSSIRKMESLPNFDLIIVDEAHHFYETKDGKGMVEKIVDKTSCKYEMLLTGSPSKFNGRGIYTFAVTINDLYDRGQVSDVIIELATANYSAYNTDYNVNYELKNEAANRETESDVNITLDNILDKVQKRLRSWHKNNPELYSKLDRNIGWLPVLGELKKTIFACKSIRQADRVSKYLTKKGISNVVSHSRNDKDSQQISIFRNDPSCLVLIVVDRGTLGFNMAELENIIDMTGSQNIDRITQLLCRVNRVHPNIKNKIFIKVSPINQVDYMHAIMTAVVCMFDREWYLKYNGKNFLDIVVPIMKEKRERKGEGTGKKKESKKVKMVDFIGLPAIEFFKSLSHKRDDAFSGVEYTTIKDVRENLINHKNLKWTIEQCKKESEFFTSISDWQINGSSSYQAAKYHGWINECSLHMNKLYTIWNLEDCKKEALKYSSRKEWKLKSPKTFGAAERKKWMDLCTEHMNKTRILWTKELCKKEALEFKTKSDWEKNKPKSYNASRINGWAEECTKHMTPLRSSWTLEKCKEIASKYNKIQEWRLDNYNSYGAAKKNKWLNECTSHMKKTK